MKIPIYIVLLFAVLFFCKQKRSNNEINKSLLEYKDTIDFDSTINQNAGLDIKFLDSLSQKVKLPYGKKELVDLDFPDNWYCGGGYLEHSLKKEGLNNQDSIKYAQGYFRIIEFNRNDNVIIDLNKSIKLNDSITLQAINNLLTTKKEDKQKRITSKISLFIKLPDYKKFKIYGLLGKGDYTFYNPIYIVVIDDKIIDILASYEYSKSETLINKSIYVDEDYVFNCKTFTNIDGYEVSSGNVISYKISDEGKFMRVD